MALDPSIPLQVKGIPLESPVTQASGILQLIGAMQQQQLQKMQMAEAQRKLASDEAMRQRIAALGPGASPQTLADAALAAGDVRTWLDITNKMKDAERIAAQTAHSQAQTRELTNRQNAIGQLGTLLTPQGYGQQPDGTRLPDAVAPNDAAAIAALQAAGNQPMTIGVPNQAGIQGLLAQINPSAFVTGMMRPNRGQVVGPGAAFVPPGATAPAFTQPFAPKSEPVVVVQTPDGPKYVPRSEAPGQAAPPRGGQAQDTIDFTPEALELRARQYLSGNPQAFTNLGRGAQGANRIVQITNKAAELLVQEGGSPKEIGRRLAEYKANSASLTRLTQSYDAITAFEQTAVRNGQILKNLATKVDTTGVPAVERWIRAGRKEIAGDTDVAQFMAQLQVYRTEAARILTNPNLTGQLTDTARREMEEFLRSGATAQQITKVVDLLERDFANRKQTLENQINAARSRIENNAGAGAAAPTVAPTTEGWTPDKERRYQELLRKRNAN